jgi:hypothetical protein
VLDRLGLERVEVSVHFRHGQTERVAQHDVLVLVPASRNNQKLFQPSSTIDYRYESNERLAVLHREHQLMICE